MADINSLVDNMKDEFQNEHDYLSEDEVDRLYNKALGIYLDISFPYAHEIVAIPETRPRAVGWVRDCMQEILERNGVNARSYSENGLSIVYDATMISNGLRARLVPLAGEIK